MLRKMFLDIPSIGLSHIWLIEIYLLVFLLNSPSLYNRKIGTSAVKCHKSSQDCQSATPVG